MKKILLLTSLFITVFLRTSEAQVIFSENFNGATPLSTWTLYNQDGRTPNAAVNYVTDAWVVREDFDTTGVGDFAATSTSWYTPAGASDDYMVTPSLTLGGASVLEWDAKAQDAAFPDGYEVRISTTGPTVAGLLANPPLYTTAAENATWVRRSVNLSTYANQTVHIAFRNTSNDMFLLLIDNVTVYTPLNDDIGISMLNAPQNGAGCDYSSADSVRLTIQNFGLNSINSFPVGYQLNNGTPVIETFTGAISPGASATFTFQTATVNMAAAGTYNFKIFTGLASDGDLSNDTLSLSIVNSIKTLPYTEDFDGLTPLVNGILSNGWVTEQNGGFSWYTNTNATTSTATGPSSDNSGSGGYVYTEGSTPAVQGEVASIISPCIDLSSNPANLTMEYFYHAYGADIGKVYVQVDTNGVWTNVDSIGGQIQTSNSAPFILRSVSLLPFLNSSNLRVRFTTTRGASFDGDFAIDDVRFYEPANIDMSLENLSTPQFVQVNTNTTISGTVRNKGLSTLNSVILNWSIDNGQVNRDTLSFALSTGDINNFSHNINWTPTISGSLHQLKVWTSEPNFQADGITTNDTLSQYIAVPNGNTVQKVALLEQFTTAVCQFCPDGAWVTTQIANNYQNVSVVSVHSCFGQDAMTNQEAADLCGTLGINSAPTAMVDRKLYPTETDVAFGRGVGYPNWQNSVWATRSLSQSQLGAAADVTLSGSYTPSTRNLNVDVNASFVDYVEPGDIRISLMFVEDSVIGTGSGYDQINAYNTQTGHPYAGAGNPIVGYPHRRVLRGVLPSTWGDATTIPANYQLNTTYTRNFNINIPTGFDENKMSLVALVNRFGGGNKDDYQVINVSEIEMNTLITSVGEQVKKEDNLIRLFPNPTANLTNIELSLNESKNVSVKVYDLAGKQMFAEDFGRKIKGKQRFAIDVSNFAEGFYFVSVQLDNQQITRKISVVK